jgi:hypothetical protein
VEKYWVPIEKIKTWPQEVQDKFFNNAYQVKPGIYSGACCCRHVRTRARVGAARDPCIPQTASTHPNEPLRSHSLPPSSLPQACPRASRPTSPST